MGYPTNCTSEPYPKRAVLINLTDEVFAEDYVDIECENEFFITGGEKRHVRTCRCNFVIPTEIQTQRGITMVTLFNREHHLLNCDCPKINNKRTVLRNFLSGTGTGTDPSSLAWTIDTLVTLENWQSRPVKCIWSWNSRLSVLTVNLLFSKLIQCMITADLEYLSNITIEHDDPYLAADYLVEYSLFCPNVQNLAIETSINLEHYGNFVHFRNWPNLKKFTLLNSNGHPENLTPLGNFDNLKELVLNDSDVVNDTFLVKLALNCPLIHILVIIGCSHVTSEGLSVLVNARHGTLRRVSLTIGNCCDILCQAIWLCTRLVLLSLSFETFSSALQFSNLSNLRSLTSLSLTNYGPENTKENIFDIISECSLPNLESLSVRRDSENFPKSIMENIVVNCPKLSYFQVNSSSPLFNLENHYLWPLDHLKIRNYSMHFRWHRVLDRVFVPESEEQNESGTIRVLSKDAIFTDARISITHTQDAPIEGEMDWLHIRVCKFLPRVDINTIKEYIENLLQV